MPTNHGSNELPQGGKPPIPNAGIGSCKTDKPPCQPPLKWYGGAVLHHPHVMMIFWGPEWGDKTNIHYKTYVKILNTEELLFKKLAGSHYNDLLTQYYDQNGQIVNNKKDPVFQGATLDFTAPPSDMNGTDVENEITNAINANPNWANISDANFMLFPQEGSTFSSGGCAFHSISNDGKNHLYSEVRYFSDSPSRACLIVGSNNLVDAMTAAASHEYAETATDPVPGAWIDQIPHYEIGDLCFPEHVALKELGGAMVQNLFDNFGYVLNSTRACSTLGALTEYPIPSLNSFPSGITAGPDGNLWFTESGYNASKIGKITPGGTIIEDPIHGSSPLGITAGPDGNLWFTDGNGHKIGKVTPY